MAMPQHWFPDNLYNRAISVAVTNYSTCKNEFKALPYNVQFDIYYKLYNNGCMCQLYTEFCHLPTFASVLKVTYKREKLHHCFQALMDHDHSGIGGPHQRRIDSILTEAYEQKCCVADVGEASDKDKAVFLGFSLGGFFSEAGWFVSAEKVFMACFKLCRQEKTQTRLIQGLECSIRLFHVRNANCKFHEAEESWEVSCSYVQQLEDVGAQPNKAALYAERCALLFAQSIYDQAYEMSRLALKEVKDSLPVRVVVDVLRSCSKICVVKREFRKAELLIKHAVYLARERYGEKHPKYADALADYGFYLLSIDWIHQAVEVYQLALSVRQAVFGGRNLHLAIVYEDLAYATYVHQYSSGRFESARQYAETAIRIITAILPDDHLLIASSKRVKALILEEIAIDSVIKQTEMNLLNEARDLHMSSLKLALKAFNENNVQTAKHYGNLGRLYQSMKLFEEAEGMHKKAIDIKERLLGPDDYEVALSAGHLASLYNYDMFKFSEAEALYLRSIKIGLSLFGEAYSGLEYDYRGLVRLYNRTDNADKAHHYEVVLDEWKELHDASCMEKHKPLEALPGQDTEHVVQAFFDDNVEKLSEDVNVRTKS